MEPPPLGAVLNLLFLAGSAFVFSWRGFHRRKHHWTAASWLGLGATVLAGAALWGFGMFFAASVGDDPASWVGAPGSSTRGYLAALATGSLVGGAALAAGSLIWFAIGDPVKPFSAFPRQVGALLFRRAHPSLPEASTESKR